MPLPLHYLFVAGLGRRAIGDREVIYPAILQVLEKIKVAAPDAQPVAIASGAAGADQVFLEAAKHLGWPIRLVLPVPVYLFEKDFTSTAKDGTTTTDEAGLATFRRLLSTAVAVDIISPSPGRRESFTRCANTLVAEADIVIALWDHAPGKQGGTNESLLLAGSLDVPCLVLEAQTGLPITNTAPPIDRLLSRYRCRHAEDSILDDIRIAVRHGLTDEQHQRFLTGKASVQEQLLGDEMANQAAQFADAYKKKNQQAIVAHLLASFFGLLAVFFAEDLARLFVATDASDHHSIAFIRAVALVGAAVGVLKLVGVFFAVKWAHTAKALGHHNQWVKTRFIREISRSLRVTPDVAYHTGETVDSFVPSSIWVLFRELRRPILQLYADAEKDRRRTSLIEALWNYRDQRLINHKVYVDTEIDRERRRARRTALYVHRGTKEPPFTDAELVPMSQQDYQLKMKHQNQHAFHAIEQRFNRATVAFYVLCALVLSFSLAQCLWPPASLPHLIHHDGWLYQLAKFLTIFLPIYSAALLVTPNLKDINRRRRVAPALARTLARLDKEAAQVEAVLTDLDAGTLTKLPDQIPVWVGTAEEQRPLVEAWARSRFAAIAREAEHAILTEVIGFKAFVENAEVG